MLMSSRKANINIFFIRRPLRKHHFFFVPYFIDYAQGFRNSSGNLAMFATIRRASTLVSSLATDRRR